MGKYSTPLKHLEVSRFIRTLRDQILALQQQEYSQDILTRLATRQPTGRPFTGDFSGEPDQIIQIKNLSNALYLAEQVFDQLEKLNLSDNTSLRGIYDVREQAAEASQLLLKLSEQVEGAFKAEIAVVASYLNVIPSFDMSKLNEFKTKIPSVVAEFSRGVGNGIGLLVDQLKPASGRLDYDFLTWVSSVLPTYIEAARHGLETSAANASLSVPKVDNKKLKEVLQQKTKKLSNSIKSIINTVSSIKDMGSLIMNLPGLFQLPSHFKEMQPLLTETLHEVDHLDETSQHFVREQLARLKYEVFPNVFALVDKFEAQMLLEPGRLSGPLMAQIKPLYEMLIQTISSYPKFRFTNKAEQLLILEDPHFMDLRLAPMREQARHSKQELHQIDLALRAVDRYLGMPNAAAPEAAVRQECYVLLKPYLTLLNKKLQRALETHLTTDPSRQSNLSTWWNSWFTAPNANPASPALNTLKAHLEQMHADHTFKLARNTAHIKSIYSKANMVLFQYNNTQSVFDLPEKEAFAHRHSLSDGVQFDGSGAIIDKRQLTPNEAWDIYQWYDNRLKSLNDVDADCDRMLTLLKANQTHNEAVLKTSTLSFHPNYIPCLLEGNTVQHQPNRLYVNIEGAALNYEVLEPPTPSACRLLKMTKVNPQTLDAIQLSRLMGHRDGFILYENNLFYFDAIQLNFVAPEYGSRLRPIMAALPKDELQTRAINSVGSQKQDFEIIQSEKLRAVCKLYLMPLDEAKTAGYRNCYVWDREMKQLSYIDPNGGVQEKITLSAQNKSMLTLFIIYDIKKMEHWRAAKTEDPVFQIITPDAPAPVDIAIEGSPKVMNIYLASIETAHRNEHKNCYVWDREVKQLSYINDKGQITVIDLNRYKNDLSKLTKIGYDLDLMVVNPEQERTENSLSHLIKLIDRKRRVDELKPKTKDIETEDLNYRNLTAENIANFIEPPTCSLYWVSEEPRLEHLTESPASLYIRTKYALYYYNKEKRSLQNLNVDQSQLKAFDKAFTVKKDIDELSSEQLIQIASITGHTPSHGGHSPGIVRKGSIPLRDLNCPLTQLTSIKPFMDYLPRVLDKALEQGHIQDPEHSECIRCYSAIQPYLVEAFKDIKIKDVRTFDKDVVNFFSGSVYKDASTPRPILSHEFFRSQLDGLKTELSARKYRIMTKHKDYFDLVQYKMLATVIVSPSTTEPRPLGSGNPIADARGSDLSGEMMIKTKMLNIESSPIKSIYHQEFSSDVADYMLSIDPVKRQLYESSKTVFRVKLALEHLKKYYRIVGFNEALFNYPEQNLANKHYPWFYPFLVQLKRTLSETSVDDALTVTRLKEYLKQILFYEEAQIQRNQAIVISFNARNSSSTEAIDLSEVTAFMARAPEFKPCLMKKSSELKPGELCLVWVGNQLSYKFLHYGKPLSGKIELAQLTPLSHLDDLTTLSNKSVQTILSIAYQQRKRDLDADKKLISFEEALELCQWYRSIPNEDKRVEYEKLAEKTPPEVKIEPKTDLKKSTLHQERSGYLIDHTECSVALATLKQSITDQFGALSDSFKHALQPAASGIPFPDISNKNPVTAWALFLSPVLNQYSEPVLIFGLGPIVSLIENAVWGLQNVAPALLQDKLYPKSPHQVIAYKSLVNIVYFLEQIMLEMEKIKRAEGESKLSRVNHLLIGYLYSADIYPLVTALSTDPHFGAFFRDILSNVDSAIKQIREEGEHYSVPKPVDQVENLNALYFMNVLKMLPERISLNSNAYKDKLPALQASSTAAMANIEKIIKDYSASYPYLRLFLDVPMILGLLNELPNDMTAFADKVNSRIKDDLYQAPPAFFLKIIMEADVWEGTLGLKPGTLSDPLKKVMDELYKGLITPLVLDTDRQVSLLCDPAPMRKRINSTFRRELSAGRDAMRYKKAPNVIQDVLNACDNPSDALTAYRRALPLFKKALNGCQLYVMSLDEAKIAEYKDCFVWDHNHLTLFYIDMEGRPTDQIHLKNTYNMVEFIAKNPRRQEANRTPIYLSESEIKHYISSNSDFVLQKNGVSLPNAVGCCMMTMPKIPEKFDELTLPQDFNAFYVQVKGVNNALYFIDRNSKQITKLDVIPEHFERKMSKVRKNKLMMHTDFNIIQSLTRHTYQPDFISNLDDFVPNQGNINQLKLLAKQCKDHYEGLYATAQLAVKIAKEQGMHLRQLNDAQQDTNLAIKKDVYTAHFYHRVDALCNNTCGLQEYTLHLLTDDLVDLKPNHLYVAINDNQLQYQVIDPAGLKQQGSFELSDIGCSLKKLASADELSAYLPQILRITSRRDNRHTRPHSLATEYQVNLRAALVAAYDPIIANAMTTDSKTIDNELNDLKDTFNTEHLNNYRQLNAVNKALDAFMAYLNTAEQQWVTRRSLFESEETIRLKRSTIDHLEELASNESDDVLVRINKIKAYLIEEPTLEHLMNFANYESNVFARVFQLVLNFFEALGLYTPTVVQRVDKLMSAIEGPDVAQPKRMRLPFFSETIRNTIKIRANALKPDDAIEPDLPGDGPEIR